MSVVIPFPAPLSPASGRRAAAQRPEPGASAEILFFTGIRYERHDEIPAPAPQRPAARRRRPAKPIQQQA